MSRERIIFGLVVCFSIAVLAGQGTTQKPKSDIPEYPPDFENQQQTTPKQPPNEFQQRMNQRMAEQLRNMPDFSRFRGLSTEQRIREMQRMARQQEEEAMKQALGVDEARWKIIEPKIEKVKACRERASVNMGSPFSSSFVSSTGSPQAGGFAGGFQYQFGGSGNMTAQSSSFQNRTSRRQTEGERICQELNALLENPNTPPQVITQKVLELQQARARARKQLAQAQKELREVLNFRQQARLVLMGLLD